MNLSAFAIKNILRLMLIVVLLRTAVVAAEGNPPSDWLMRWNQPLAEDRPLQIVHGIQPRKAMPDGVAQIVNSQAATPERVVAADDVRQAAENLMQFYKGIGLGGVVCNVDFKDYMQSEEKFAILSNGVEACRKAGLLIWLYDEDGYPSGAAGGLVLKDNPAFEASELAYDPTADGSFVVRPAYEHTHASNNFYAARRYVNLLDPRATQSFIDHTHEVYWKRLEKYFGTTIQATFTDEPSLMAINIGPLSDEVRKKVRVQDPLDPNVRALPSVPWCGDLAERYRSRYCEDLMLQRKSLFSGDAPEDRKVRRQFWALVADLVAERYYGTIQRWCGGHRIASSGHILWEEALMHHPALEGNGLKALSRMDIPGLDMLSSDPEVVIHDGWLTAGLPCSAAVLTGRRRVMTEVSDFIEKMGKRGPAGLPEMQATAAWQAAWGVTDFTLYYGVDDRPHETYRAYCEYVGRLNAVLKPARVAPEVLLYYPIYDLWAEYRPVAEPLKLESQSPQAQKLFRSFNRLGQTMQRCQIAFSLVDHEFLAGAKVMDDGALVIGQKQFKAIVLPEGVELPEGAARVVEEFRAKGGRVMYDGADAAKLSAKAIRDALAPTFRLASASDPIAVGHFLREERDVYLVVNVGRDAYKGSFTAGKQTAWQRFDPATGAVQPAAQDADGRVLLTLAGRQAMLFVRE